MTDGDAEADSDVENRRCFWDRVLARVRKSCEGCGLDRWAAFRRPDLRAGAERSDSYESESFSEGTEEGAEDSS